MKKTIVIPRDARPDRLDRWIAELGGLSRRRARKVLAAGGVWVDDSRVRVASRRVGPGQRIRIHPGAPELVARLAALPDPDVLFRDQYLLVVNKPRGMVVEPTPQTDRGTVLARVSEALGGVRVTAPHRLDRDATGCLLLAVGERTRGQVHALVADRVIERRYEAAVHNGTALDELPAVGEWQPLHHLEGRTHDGRRVALPADDPAGGRDMRLAVRVLEESGTARLVQVRLETGRTHQIRLQLASAAGPLMGDAIYGAEVGPLALHASRLSFVHPVTGAEIRCLAERPSDFPWPSPPPPTEAGAGR